MIGLLDALGIEQVDVVAHDHGAATAQLIAAGHPDRIRRLVLTNAEAYDNWPSADELPFSHLLMEERPDDLARLVSDFLAPATTAEGH